MVITMLELLEKLEELKDELDKLEIFSNLEESIQKIKKNQELINKIKKYNETLNNNLRLDIYNYDEIKEYKKLENEINFLILSINNKFNLINDKRSCNHESN